MVRVLRLLSIAGADSAGCAGIAADLRTFAALGAHGSCAITSVTAQDSDRLRALHIVPAEMVAAQIAAVVEDLGVDAVKVGLLPNAAVAAVVARTIHHYGLRQIVIDPVLRSSGGDALAPADGVRRLLGELAAQPIVLTPNLEELEALSGIVPDSLETIRRAAAELAGPNCSVVVTGGHRAAGGRVRDVVVGHHLGRMIGGAQVRTVNSRGTGCVHSAALAVGLARGLSLSAAARLAQDTVRRGLRQGYPMGRSARPVTAP